MCCLIPSLKPSRSCTRGGTEHERTPITPSLVVPTEVRVRERSDVELDEAVFRRLEALSSIDGLIEAGVVTLVRSRRTHFGIRAGPFVGSSRLASDLTLTIEEKSAGALRALLAYGLPEEVRAAPAPSYIAPDSPVLEVFALRFLEALGAHLSKGRVKEYRRTLVVGATPRGSVDIARTARLHARGLADRLAYSQPTLTADIAINQAFAVALHAVESYAVVAHAGVELRLRARRLAALFEDVPVSHLLRSDFQSLRLLIDRAFEDRRASNEVRTALQFARALVLFLGAWSDKRDSVIPESYFANLERMFEAAVREVLGEVFTPHRVVKGRALGTPLFDDREDRYIVDPDAVVLFAGSPRLVADVKYKELEGLPDHSDVYQLAAHTRALNVANGLLIYPGEVPNLFHLGQSPDVTISWATVRPTHLLDDLAGVAAKLTL